MNSMPNVLVIDDEEGMRSFLRDGLQADGHNVVEAVDGPTGLVAALDKACDVVILDLGLPKLDGMHVLEQLKEHRPETPVIVLSARDSIDDRVAALDGGAVDYVLKPFALAELLARVRLRVKQDPGGLTSQPIADVPKGVITSGRVTLDTRRRLITIDEETIVLTPLETSLTEAFLRSAGEVLTREQLLKSVWGMDEAPPRSNLVEVAVVSLRKRLGSGFIETVRGLGYRFSA